MAACIPRCAVLSATTARPPPAQAISVESNPHWLTTLTPRCPKGTFQNGSYTPTAGSPLPTCTQCPPLYTTSRTGSTSCSGERGLLSGDTIIIKSMHALPCAALSAGLGRLCTASVRRRLVGAAYCVATHCSRSLCLTAAPPRPAPRAHLRSVTLCQEQEPG